MEPRDQELTPEPKVPSPATERKLKRFRIVKLEERIAPSQRGNTTHDCYSLGAPGLKGCVGTFFHC
jgi:hypothetical protein